MPAVWPVFITRVAASTSMAAAVAAGWLLLRACFEPLNPTNLIQLSLAVALKQPFTVPTDSTDSMCLPLLPPASCVSFCP